MTVEQINKEIELIDQQIKELKDHRCETLVCTNNEYETSSKIQDLSERRAELYYQSNPKIEKRHEGQAVGGAEQAARHKEKVEIAKNLLDVLEDDVISAKTGLSIDAVKELRK